MPRRALVLILATVLMPVVASAQDEPPSKLPIDVPKEAFVTYEVDGPGKKLLPAIKQLTSGQLSDPTAPPVDKISVKTPIGDVTLTLKDLEPILASIHYLHVVTYKALPSDDPFKQQERFFSQAGLQKIVSVPGSDGVLIMRHQGKTEQYGVVVRTKGLVVILRSEGGPGLGAFGQIAYETLARLVARAAPHKK